MSKVEAIYKKWVSNINLSHVRIINFPAYVFLCGGGISDSPDTFFSCRDIFYKYTYKNEFSFYNNIILAENILKFFQESIYKNLLDFERDIAELSSITVLFSESAGSIAELGFFSVTSTIKNKVIVVLHRDDSYTNSFIWKGPVHYLQQCRQDIDPVLIYNWTRNNNSNVLNYEDFEDSDDLSELVDKILNTTNDSSVFNKSEKSHIMLFTVGILQVIQIATLTELKEALDLFGIQIEKEVLKSYLSLLTTLDFIGFLPYSNYQFYVANSSKRYVTWKYKDMVDTRNRDIYRWIAYFSEFYNQYDLTKSRALRSYYKRL